MNKIEDLKQQITEIENQAGDIDPTDYEALYKLLAVAYFAAKDIIELQDGNVPVAIDKDVEAKLGDAEGTLKTQASEIEYLNGTSQ